MSSKFRRRRPAQLTLILLVIALIGFGLLIALAPFTKIDFWAIDLYTFRAAAKAMQANADPYLEPNIVAYADGTVVGNIHNYIYAPYFAFVLRPLAWLSPETASRGWFTLNLVLYFGSIGLLLQAIGWKPTGNNFLVVMVGLILFPPLRTTLTIGQSTILILFSFSLGLFLLKKNHPVWGGLVYSLGLFKPHLAPILLFFILGRRWRFLAGVLLGLALVTLPFWGWLDNWLAAAANTRRANLSYEECFQMVSLTSLAKCTIASPLSLNLLLLASVLLAALVVVVDLKRHVRQIDLSFGSPDFDRSLALVVVLNGLIVDHTRIADQLLFVFPLLVIWRDWPALHSVWGRRTATGLILSIYLIPYILDFLQSRAIVYALPFWYIGISLATLILLLVYRPSASGENYVA